MKSYKDILLSDEVVKVVKKMKEEVRKIYGPNPPCIICGKESESIILPRPLQPSTWAPDLQRQISFYDKFPFGAWICADHSNEELTAWFKKRNVKLRLKKRREKR